MQQVLGAAFQNAASHLPYLGIGTAKLQYSEKYIKAVDLVLRAAGDMDEFVDVEECGFIPCGVYIEVG